MANNKTTYLTQKIINHVLRNTPYTQPTTVYVSLHTADPGESGSHTNEVSTSGTAYARKSVAFDAPTGDATQNTADVLFDQATASWGTITHIGIEENDVEGGGNMLYYGPLSASVAIGNGEQLRIPAGDIDLSET